MVVGSPLLGRLGDRFGRRITVILGTVLYGTFALLCAQAHSVTELIVLRFITGIGLGGMLPNITALNAEFAPQCARATLVVLMFMGVTAGSSLPALVVAAAPDYGWQILYIVGGVVPLAVAVVLFFLLPESIKFLSLRQDKNSRMRLEQLVRKVRPDLAITPDTVFVTMEAGSPRRVAVGELFRDGLQWITPLLWLLFIVNLTANYFLYSWMPVLFRAGGFSDRAAALTTACYYVGGVIGGLTISRLIDRRGLLPVAVFSAGACPAVACIGIPGLPPGAISGLVFLGGFGVLGVQLGLNAVSGLIYPTQVRATGAGWAFGLGRVGGIIGPMLGAAMIAMHLSTAQVFLAPALSLAMGTAACFALVRLCRARFHGDQLNEAAVISQPAPEPARG
jgi:AAHS family 4-hydroxybenzoate transporter-like MFS transporter